MTIRDIRDQYRTAGKALEGGATRRSPLVIEHNVAGRCKQPKLVETYGRPSGAFGVVAGKFTQDRDVVVDPPRTQIPIAVDFTVRCRKCRTCLQHRSSYWTSRAIREVDVSNRTWFTTLTLGPDRAWYYLELARERRAQQGVHLDADNPDERFRQWCAEVGTELTRFVKRVRKNSGANLRYIFVFERHRSGTPHIHGLVHECGADNPVTKRAVQAAWHEGFSHCKLIDRSDKRTVRYVTKYLSKDASARIRASLHYGEGNVLRGSIRGGSQEALTPADGIRVSTSSRHNRESDVEKNDLQTNQTSVDFIETELEADR